jgi:PAS domain S-box-containing protein
MIQKENSLEAIYIGHDISERKVAEDKLCRSEQCIRWKLAGIIPSARKVENLLLADIIDVPVIQSLMNDFYKLAPIPMGLNDLKGNVLVSVGWQDICTKFHRVHPEASTYCVESDTKLSLDATPGELKMYKCKNNMWDIVTPIMLDGQHVGYVFSGQFFFDDDPLDYEFFRSQARKYDFNEEEYIAALTKVPRLSREAVNTSMTFLMTFANTLSQVSYSNFMLAQSLEEFDVLMNVLQESEEHFHTMANAIPQLAWIAHPDGYIYWYNDRWYSYTGTKQEQMEGWGWQSVHDPDVLPKVLEQWKASIVTGQMFDMELPLRGANGLFRPFLTRVLLLKDAAGNILQWFGTSTDVTECKKTEEALKEARDSLEEKVKERTEELYQAYN